ncbi:MAG: molybdopterin converting factor subunit 1 [Myxococcales bacterium]|nr:molybdopterin converting factor subunit 1 [Polyangiaceae bacterium]MDW8248603.1 molybdopterin converting factor subunit 1 [Myxococcales bacterium]
MTSPTISILYFAALRDLARCSEETLPLPPAVRHVADLPAFLALHRPVFAGRLGQVRIARNERFADPDEPVLPGDVIALIPPVAGG